MSAKIIPFPERPMHENGETLRVISGSIREVGDEAGYEVVSRSRIGNKVVTIVRIGEDLQRFIRIV